MLHIHTLSQLCIQRDSLSSIRVSLPGCALRSMHYSVRFSRSSPSALRRSFCHIETQEGELAKGGDLDEIRTKNNPSALPSSFIALSCAGSSQLTVGQRPATACTVRGTTRNFTVNFTHEPLLVQMQTEQQLAQLRRFASCLVPSLSTIVAHVVVVGGARDFHSKSNLD